MGYFIPGSQPWALCALRAPLRAALSCLLPGLQCRQDWSLREAIDPSGGVRNQSSHIRSAGHEGKRRRWVERGERLTSARRSESTVPLLDTALQRSESDQEKEGTEGPYGGRASSGPGYEWWQWGSSYEGRSGSHSGCPSICSARRILDRIRAEQAGLPPWEVGMSMSVAKPGAGCRYEIQFRAPMKTTPEEVAPRPSPALNFILRAQDDCPL